MEYFTPELYERINSDDSKVVAEAMAAWDAAEAAYLTQRAQWLPSAPASVVDLATKLCLHDAALKLESWTQHGQYLLVASTDEEMTILLYDAVEQPRVVPATKTGRCWSSTRSWLYDEVSDDASGVYRHRILLSDASERDIRFRDVRVAVRAMEPNGLVPSRPTSGFWFFVPASGSPARQTDIQPFFSQPEQFEQLVALLEPAETEITAAQ